MSQVGIDQNNNQCSFDNCFSPMMIGHGGLVEHHEVPKSLGGAENGKKLELCPNHHYRQHALIRYFVENYPVMKTQVLVHYTADERAAALVAYQGWIRNGKPAAFWPTPAAR